MTWQDRRLRAGRNEGGSAGRPGNPLPFLGKVSGNGQTYKEGEKERRAELGKPPKVTDGLCTHKVSTKGKGCPYSTTAPPPLPSHNLPAAGSEHGKLLRVSQSVSQMYRDGSLLDTLCPTLFPQLRVPLR